MTAKAAVAILVVLALLGVGCEAPVDGVQPPASAAASTIVDSGAGGAASDELSQQVELASVPVPQPATGFDEALLQIIRTPTPVRNFGLDADGGIVIVGLAEVDRNGLEMFGTRVDRLSPSGMVEWTRVHLCVPNGPAPGGTRGFFSELAVDAQGNALLGGTFSARCNVAGTEIEATPNPAPRYRSSGFPPIGSPDFRDGILFRHTRDGASMLAGHIRGPGIQELTSVVAKPEGGFRVGGAFQGVLALGGRRYLSPNGGGPPVWFWVDTDADGLALGNALIETEPPSATVGAQTHYFRRTQLVVDRDGNTYSVIRTHYDTEVASARLERGAWLVALDASGTLRWTRPLALSSVEPPANPSLALSDDRLAAVHARTMYDIEGTAREHECPETGYVSDLEFLELSLDNELLREFTITRCGGLVASRLQSHPAGGWMFIASVSADANNPALTEGANLLRVPPAE